ncbi:hypothetical protein NSQ96_01095 [Caldifermentibacillus hisashii]|uniref:hypothetical protein n=1 Tax=Caldifermentibacillus hisashii TaxID=996558 RepID=UPI0031FC812F
MKLPNSFDINEWFVLISMFIAFSVLHLLPKRFPLSISILIMLYSSTIARFADHILAMPRIDLYDIMNSPYYDLFDIFTYVLIGLAGYFFVYFYDRLRIKGYWIAVYIVIWSVFGTAYEWLSSYFKVFIYKGWKPTYSFSVYLLVQSLTLFLFNYITFIHQKTPKDN